MPFNALHSAVQIGLLLTVFGNSALVQQQSTESRIVHNTSYIALESPAGTQSGSYSATLDGTLTFLAEGNYTFNCTFVNMTAAMVWVGGHQICTAGADEFVPGKWDNPLMVRKLPVRGLRYTVRATFWADQPASFGWMWNAGVSESQFALGPIPASYMVPNVSAAEQKRMALQNGMVQTPSWGTYYKANPLTLVQLPSGFTITPKICPVFNASTVNCIQNEQLQWGNTWVGPHAIDGSYAQLHVANQGSAPKPGSKDAAIFGNFSVSFSSNQPGPGEFHYAVERVTDPTTGGSSPFDVDFETRFAWFRRGRTSFDEEQASITIQPVGLPPTTLYLRRTENDGLVTLSTNASLTARQVQALIAAQGERHIAALTKRLGDGRVIPGGRAANADQAVALEAAVAWNTVFNPLEASSLFIVVSRGWNAVTNPANADWNYVIFEWDTCFATYLTAVWPSQEAEFPAAKKLAYSTFIQLVMTKTDAGFIPNVAAGGGKSRDRTEPPLAARVLYELYRKFNDLWLVELLYDNVADQNDWFFRARNCSLGLICLGSWDIASEHCESAPIDESCNFMQAARYESGMDNSPMYDGNFFNNGSTDVDGAGPHQMELHDVGFSALVAMEAKYLDKLHAALVQAGVPILTPTVWRQRLAALQASIAANLWDPQEELYVNSFTKNNSFYRHGARYSPTSFFPMLANVPTDDQAAVMVTKWLLNPNHFCVAPDGNMTGNHEDCYWGLPSIQRNSTQFMSDWPYWRGYIWGPLGQFTYWALEEYAHVPAVRQGRDALASQFRQMFLTVWQQYRAVCENYCPGVETGCCGDAFYEWGGLTGLLSVQSAGLY